MKLPLSIRIRVGEKRYGRCGPTSIRLSSSRIFKGNCHKCELEALTYVAQHTTIPVPAVHEIYDHASTVDLVLDYVEGESLDRQWGKLSLDQRRSISNSLKGYIDQLRKLRCKRDGLIGSAALGKARDGRIGSRGWGPFSKLEDFNTLLRGVSLDAATSTYGEEVTKMHQRVYDIKFTHADFVPRNIIIHNGKVVGIIDWAFAGWYPEYWEWTKANFAPRGDLSWFQMLADIIPKYDEELKLEKTLWSRYPEPVDDRRRNGQGKWVYQADSIPIAS